MISSTRCFISKLTLCCVLVFLSHFRITSTSLWENRAFLCAFRAFVCFADVGLCLFPLSLNVRDKQQLEIVAGPSWTFLFIFSFFLFCFVNIDCNWSM